MSKWRAPLVQTTELVFIDFLVSHLARKSLETCRLLGQTLNVTINKRRVVVYSGHVQMNMKRTTDSPKASRDPWQYRPL